MLMKFTTAVVIIIMMAVYSVKGHIDGCIAYSNKLLCM